MRFIRKLSIDKPTLVIYPLVIIIAIPVLLIINTWLNLRYFNRDSNYFIRRQAVSIAETITPFINDSINSGMNIDKKLVEVREANEDILNITLLTQRNNEVQQIAGTENNRSFEETSNIDLNNFAFSTNQPYAGLSYNPNYEDEVWNVSVPFSTQEQNYVIAMQLSNDYVDTLLQRTARDSLIILAITVIVVLILLINHFIFYKRSLKAQQLSEIDKLKDEFISLASHELRAPVTAIVGYLELLEDKVGEDALPKIQNELDTLNRVTRDLNSLINDLLEVSRIEQDRIQLNISRVDINQIIQDTIDKFNPQADQKGLELNFEKGDIPTTKSDPDRIRQILVNLVSNSIKYTNEGSISIISTKEDNDIKLTVKDTGVGIPGEQIEKLFTKFHRVKDEKTPEAKGTGLGLWITKKMIENLGGKIYVESIYGTGSSFTVILPIR